MFSVNFIAQWKGDGIPMMKGNSTLVPYTTLKPEIFNTYNEGILKPEIHLKIVTGLALACVAQFG